MEDRYAIRNKLTGEEKSFGDYILSLLDSYKSISISKDKDGIHILLEQSYD